MKKNNIDLESRFWSGWNRRSPVPLMEVFFRFHDPETAKEGLNRIMQYALQGKVRIREDPSVVFHFHQSLRSFLRAGWCLRKKLGKWTVDALPEHSGPLVLGSLSEEEYRDPVMVFCYAFRAYSLEAWEEFLAEAVYFSLGTFSNVPERDIISPYIHLVKMLDAAQLIVERRSMKNNKDPVTGKKAGA